MLVLFNLKSSLKTLHGKHIDMNHHLDCVSFVVPVATHGHETKTNRAQSQALDKGFAQCNTRQAAHGIYNVGKQLFAECFLSRTRQMIYRVSNLILGKKKSVLLSVFQNTLGKILFTLLFAECF